MSSDHETEPRKEEHPRDNRNLVAIDDRSTPPSATHATLPLNHRPLQQPLQSLPHLLDGTKPDTTTTTPTCLARAAGQVCICQGCEAVRMRLLDRASKTDAHPKKKRAREEGVPAASAADAASSGNQTALTAAAVVFKNSLPGCSCGNQKLCRRRSGVTASVVASGDALSEEHKLATMSDACKTILSCIGEDPEREGLLKTPERWAKALLFFCSGYNMTPMDVTNGAVFSENHNEMVVVRNIAIHSLCEHHMVPFTGQVSIGYIPNGKILGLSKLARIAELFSRRLQVQERLTRQIADAVVETISPLGVAVVVECTHFCMVMRGVQKTGAITTSSSVRGCFETNSKTRAEFFSILHGGVKQF